MIYSDFTPGTYFTRRGQLAKVKGTKVVAKLGEVVLRGVLVFPSNKMERTMEWNFRGRASILDTEGMDDLMIRIGK